MVTTDLMEARYGRKRRADRDRRLVVVLGSVLMMALVAFIIYAAFGKPTEIKSAVTDIKTPTSHTLTANVTFTNPTDKPARCQVSAVNGAGSSVGSIEVKVPADKTSAQAISITTVETADGGAVVDSCWNS